MQSYQIREIHPFWRTRILVPPFLVLCLVFSNTKIVTKRKSAITEEVQGQVASDHG